MAQAAAPASAPDGVLADPDLLALVSRGDVGALAEIYDRHIDCAWRVALHFSASGAAAEDAVATTFLHLWKNPAPGDERGLLARILSSVTREARASHPVGSGRAPVR